MPLITYLYTPIINHSFLFKQPDRTAFMSVKGT